MRHLRILLRMIVYGLSMSTLTHESHEAPLRCAR